MFAQLGAQKREIFSLHDKDCSYTQVRFEGGKEDKRTTAKKVKLSNVDIREDYTLALNAFLPLILVISAIAVG